MKKKIIKIIGYILWLSVISKLANSINNHEWIWIILGLIAVPYWGYIIGFGEDMEKIRNYIK